MKNYHARVRHIVVLAAAALCLMTIQATTATAQRSGRSTGMERRSEEMNRRREQLEREMLLRGVEPKSEDPSEERRDQATVSQVRQDFERIQAIYNQIVIAMSANQTLDYRFVSDATSEIRKRSSRLKSNLSLPPPEDDEKSRKKQNDQSGEPLETALLVLSNHIKSFVTNPLFESSGVIDVNLSNKASLDLKKIIELSDSIRKRADKLNKTGN